MAEVDSTGAICEDLGNRAWPSPSLLILATLVIGGAVDARRRHPDLKPWHELVPDDVDAGELTEDFTFERWLQPRGGGLRRGRRARTPRRDGRPDARQPLLSVKRHPLFPPRPELESHVRTGACGDSRWGGPGARPDRFTVQHARRRRAAAGGGLLLLALRMPGHGTVPAGLIDADWEDWLAAVRMGMRHARQTSRCRTGRCSWSGIRMAARWR